MKISVHLITFLIVISGFSNYAQQNNVSPYETDFVKDGIWVTAGVGLNVLGVILIQNKPPLSDADLENLSKNDIWKFDRWAAGYHSEKADNHSYIPMFAAFALPVVVLLNKNERSHTGQLSVIFLESMATTGALFSITAALVEKSRPLVYDTSMPTEKRTANDEQRSFYAGHTAATASATFFAAKVYSDFNPESPLRPYVWGAAATIPAVVGYLRIKAGKHFLSDNLIGYVLGAASGILIPELHKKGNKNLNVFPATSFIPGDKVVMTHGIGISYQF